MSDGIDKTELEKKAFLEDLRRQNEAILQEYKKKMEAEFENRMKEMLQDMKISSDTSTESNTHSQRQKIDNEAADEMNDAFFQACNHHDTAPQMNIYRGESREAIVRASRETADAIKPAVITSTGAVVREEGETCDGPANASSPVPDHLRVYVESVAPPVPVSAQKSKKKRLTKAEFMAELAEKERIINSVSATSSEELDPLEKRMADTTQSVLMKSREMIREASKVKGMKGYKSNKKRVGKMPKHKYDRSSPPTESHSTLPKVRTVDVSGSRNVAPAAAGSPDRHLPPVEETYSYEEEEVVADADEVKHEQGQQYVTLPRRDSEQEEIDGYLNKFSWENHLARHILSVFASSQVPVSKSQSTAVFEFIDNGDSTKPSDLKEQGMFKDLRIEREAVEQKSKRPGTGGAKTAPTDSDGSPKGKLGRKKSTSGKISTAGFRALENDPVKKVARGGETKMKVSDRKQRDEIQATGRTGTALAVVRAPPKCFPIWFYSSGDVYAEWLSLPNGHQLQNSLDALRELKNYMQYLEIVSSILDSCWIDATYRRTHAKQMSSTTASRGKSKSSSRRVQVDAIEIENEEGLSEEELRPLCYQLVIVANAFATLALENKQSDKSMQMIRIAETWTAREDIFSSDTRTELKSYIAITLAFYFFKRKMTSAALSHTEQALATHRKLGNDSYVAQCLLMLSCCKYQISNFKAAHKVLYQVLDMIEEGRLAFEEAKPKELCMVAVAYHNLAVIQLRMQVPDAAAKSSQNARKIARLCLSHSNRWINVFHWTHQLALEDLKYQLQHNYTLSETQTEAMADLTANLYDPLPS